MHSRRAWSARRSAIAGVGLTAGVALGIGPAAAQATDFTVSTNTDGTAPGPAGSLRKAVSDANANPGADQILFDAGLTGDIILSSNGISITDALTISGPGANELAVDAYLGTGRIFTVDPVTPGDPVTISGLTMAYGQAASGGAIFNEDAKLTIADSFLFGNTATFTGLGGGAVADNANYASGAQTTIEDSTISGNTATQGAAGGVGSVLQLGRFVNSTISHNYAYTTGGGLRANDDGATLQNSTVANNYAYGSGGGLLTGTGGPGIAFQNSIVAGNQAYDSGPDLFGADPMNAEFSLVGNTAGATISSTITGSNLLNSDPQLPYYLSNLYGDTPTLPPAFDSVVIDQGKAAASATLDQRGETRPFDLPGIANSAATGADGADMGAVELTAFETTPADMESSITDSPDPATVGGAVTFTLEVTNNGPETAADVDAFAVLPPGLAFRAAGTSAGCTPSPDPPGTRVTCVVPSLLSGSTATRSIVADAASQGSFYTYGYAFSERADQNVYNNVSYAETVVASPPSAPPAAAVPAPAVFDVRAAIKKCAKRFRGKAKSKQRKKCIQKARKKAAVSAASQGELVAPHPFVARERPEALKRLPARTYLRLRRR
jgi:uncharacterized repeat protein (TIGR01451 family)